MTKSITSPKSHGSKVVVVTVSVLCVGAALFVVRSFFRGGTPAAALYSTFICTETGKTFQHRLEPGEIVPIVSPFTRKNTGVPAETCFWTADGGTKDEPTWVLLNEWTGKAEPTFCPDCGRLVVGRNPVPTAGMMPPPTENEYAAKQRSPSADLPQNNH